MRMKSKVRSRESPCEMSMKSEGKTKSAHKASPALGLTSRGYLSDVMRYFLESSLGRKSVHMMPRTNLNQDLQTEPE